MKFYRQQLLRLAKIAVTLIVLSLTATIISSVLAARGCVSTGVTGAGEHFRYISKTPDISQYAPTLLYFAAAAGVVMALYGFSFLNKRSESDFYLSLPIRRSKLFVAVTLAGASWILVGILANVLISLAVFGMYGVPLVPAYPALLIGFFFTLAMLIFAAAALALTLTGTWVSSIVATVVILLLPRAILYLLGQMIVSQTQLIRLQGFGPLLNPMYNILTATIGKLFSNRSIVDVLTFVPGILYSMGIVLFELLLSGLLFCRRPSETTGQSTSRRALQDVFACGLAFLAMAPILYWSPFMNQSWSKRNALIFMALAGAIYVVCQMVQKKSIKRALYSLPWMAAPIAMIAILIGMAHFGADRILNDVPQSNEIDYVTFNYGDQNNKYETEALKNIRFADDASKETVVKALADSVDMVRYYRSLDNKYFLNYGFSVDIHLKDGRILKRALPTLGQDDVYVMRQNNAAYRKALHDVPGDPDVMSVVAWVDYGSALPAAQAQALLDVYTEEAAALQESGFPAYSEDWTTQQLGWLTVYACHGSKITYNEYYITEKMPKTASLYMSFYNEYCGMPELESAMRWLQQMDDRRNENMLGDGDSFSCTLDTYHCILPPDRTQMYPGYASAYYSSWNWYPSGGEESEQIYQEICEVLEILQRGTFADDVTQFCVRAVCSAEFYNEHAATRDNEIPAGGSWNSMRQTQPYLSFSAEDAKRLEELIYTCRLRNEGMLNELYASEENAG